MKTTETTEASTVEQIIHLARRENLSCKKIRSLLFHSGHDYKLEIGKILEALGREKGDGGEANRIAKKAAKAASEKLAGQVFLARAEKVAAMEAAEMLEKKAAKKATAAAKSAIRNGDTIWCDAAPNTVRKTVNRFGKKIKYDNGGYRIGLVVGEFENTQVNSSCPDQFAGECYAVLKAVELAVECGLSHCLVRNDRIGGFKASTKRGYDGAKYLWIASKIADKAGLDVDFDLCTGEENRADGASRKGSEA